jgi:sugar phosphate isomerase/epimerase
MDRRQFVLGTVAAALQRGRLLDVARRAGVARPLLADVALGSIDGSVSGNQFTPAQFLDYLSSIKLTWAMISLPADVIADESAVRQIRDHADQLGIRLQLAHGSVCPSSRSFNAQLGTLEVQVSRALRASQIFGASCMRCILGGDPERPAIETHIDDMIKAVGSLRSRIVDSGVKLAVENHGGDLQAREMKMMIDAVGRDVMGVCLDSGNPVWMLEDPHMTLETLIPYTLTCHVRDSAVWMVPEGIAVRWVNMGEGNVDIDGWIRKFITGKPGLPIIFENLVSGAPRVHAIYDPKFWDNWRQMPAWEFSRFLAIAEKGTPKPATPRPAGKTAGQQKIDDLEVCVRYTRELLRRI